MDVFNTGWAALVAGQVLPLAWCWKVTRLDGTVFGFTTCVTDLTVEGVTYEGATGFMATDIEDVDSLAVNNLQIEGMLTSDSITVDDIKAGRWDGAQLQIFYVNFEDLSIGKRWQFVGSLGAITVGRISFSTEQNGLTEPLSQNVGDLTSVMCRAILGDIKCKVDLGPYTRTGTVSQSTWRSFVDAARTEPIGWWTGGVVKFTSGACAGMSIEIKRSTDQGYIEFVLPLLPGISDGDTYSMTPGCNHLLKAPGPPQSQSGAVEHDFTQQQFTATGLNFATGYFNGGVLSWTSGENAGHSVGINTYGYDGVQFSTIVVATLQGGVINIADEFVVTANVDVAALFAISYDGDCKNKYDNVDNFQGEPEIPGLDSITQYGGRVSA